MSKGGLLRSSAIFSAMTLISRVSGLVRDQVYAWQFGASPAMDAFFIAFRIPNFLRRLSAEGSFSMAFVPVLAEYKENQDHAAVKDLVDRVAGTLAAALLGHVSIAAAQDGAESTDSKEKTTELSRIEVTGSNIRRTDVETASPVQVISKQDIENMGARTLLQVLDNLPAARPGQQDSRSLFTGSDGASLSPAHASGDSEAAKINV